MDELLWEPEEGRELRPAPLLPIELCPALLLPIGLRPALLLPIELPLLMPRLGLALAFDALLLEDLRAALLLELLRDALLDFARVVFPLELRLALLRDFGRAALARALARGLARGLARAVLRDFPRAELALFRALDFLAPRRAELDFFRLADERLRDDDDLALLPPLEPFAIGSPF